jgi:ubiquinone/menaquinone biosynthesis C-methylase UbiE
VNRTWRISTSPRPRTPHNRRLSTLYESVKTVVMRKVVESIKLPLYISAAGLGGCARVFICSECGRKTTLPKCTNCGYIFRQMNGIYQMTDDPDMNLDDDKGDKYIGYEHIGHYLEGRHWIECTPVSMKIGEKISEITQDGVLLDVGCGSGYLAVTAALNGCKVIAGDISNRMLSLLKEKAKHSNADFDKLMLCRMNALFLPIAEESIDSCIANCVLHLISNPQRVIDEIYRVLKPGGMFISMGNSPGLSLDIEERQRKANESYTALINEFYSLYWKKLNLYGVYQSKYSWKFDQHVSLREKFNNMTEITIDFYDEQTSTPEDYFLYRMQGKAFSDQSSVPDDIHQSVFNETMTEMKGKHGDDFVKTPCLQIINGIKLCIFTKN